MRLTGLFVALAVAVAEGATPQTPVVRSAVEVVRVDAVVVDREGQPIRGLTASDFRIREDGAPRPVTAFEAIDMPVGPATPDAAAWVRDAPRDVVSNALEDRRLFMLVIDDAGFPRDPRLIERSRRIARDVVSRLNPFERAAIVFTGASGKAQPFTSDHARLNAAIDALSGGRTGGYDRPMPGDMLGELAAAAQGMDGAIHTGIAWTIKNAVDLLATAPQVRKTLVLISAGVAYDPFAPAMSQKGEGAARIKDELHQVFTRAEAGHVTVYAFDANDDVMDTSPQMALSRDFLRIVTANTGGRAAIGADDPARAVGRMFSESSVYYLLGFESGATGRGRHDVEITTTRAGAKVLSKKTFETTRDARPATAAAAPPLSKAMRGLLPTDGLPMRVTATVVPAPGAPGAMVALVLGVNQPVSSDGGAELLTARVNAYKTDGTFGGATELKARLVPRPTLSGRAQYDLLGTLALKPGRYQLRIAAESAAHRLSGSVYADVDVPDFAKAAVTVSPLVIATTPSVPAAPADAFAALLPVRPTSHRIYADTDRVTVLARVTQGGKRAGLPMTADVRVRNAADRVVLSRSEPVAMAAGRTADYLFDLPVATLPPGDYLLTITITTAAGTSTQSARFARR